MLQILCVMYLAALCIVSLGAWAQESDEDWPDQIDYRPNSRYIPQEMIDNPLQAGRLQYQREKAAQKAQKARENPGKKKWRLFGQKEAPPPSEEQIVEVGPREYPMAREPLFRLPIGIITPEGRTLSPGFYLVRPLQTPSGEWRLQLLQEGRLRHEVTAHPGSTPPPAEPVGPVKSSKPPTPFTRVEARVSPDFTQLSIIVRQPETEYQSDPLPTIMTQRPALRF